MHARLVYYVYIGKSRDFTRICCNNLTAGAARIVTITIITIKTSPSKNFSKELVFLYFHNNSYSSNSGVEKYRSAVSGRTVTTVFPAPNFLASLIAAATFVPEEIPHMIPSFEASSRDV